jgi:hypothetical protein
LGRQQGSAVRGRVQVRERIVVSVRSSGMAAEHTMTKNFKGSKKQSSPIFKCKTIISAPPCHQIDVFQHVTEEPIYYLKTARFG